MKKAGAILLTAAMSVTMVATFAACGGGNDGDTATEKVVKVWLHKSKTEDEGKTYAALEELFNEADYKTQDGRDIVMRIEYKSNADQLKTAITSEMGMGGAGLPDIVAVDAPDIASYADSRAGILVSIDDYVTAEEKSDYVDSVIEQSTVGGKLYALSGADAPAGLYYNKEALSKANITPGTVENPWSWSDLAKNIQALKTANQPYKIQLSLGFGGNEGLMYLYAPLVYSASGEFADAQGKVKASLTSQNSIAGLTSFADFMKKAKANAGDVWSYSGTSGDAAFPTGKLPS